MPTEIKREIELKIAHVLFIDIVAYSKMASDDQRAAIEKLNQIVQSTEEFRKSESQNRLLKLATGDGMALIFYDSPEAPVECALEISRALKQHPQRRLRMGAHSGPVSGVVDVNGRANVAGAGINMAQRAIALTPVEKDVSNSSHVLQYFAITAAWAGEKELALQQLEAGLRAPNASLMLSYGALKLFPVWDPLRASKRLFNHSLQNDR
jgi:class 3 adenylate cyclase